MADHNAVITAWLLQMHFAMHRAQAVSLVRAPRTALGGEHVKLFEGKTDECRNFTDAAGAEAFIRRAIEEGDVVGIAYSKDELFVMPQLGILGHLLAANPEVDALMIGPTGVARVKLRASNLKHAAEVFGTATLFGLSVILEAEVSS